MRIALTRLPSPRLQDCALTHIDRKPIDAAKARAQHLQYENVIRSLGFEIVRLPETPGLPDGVFVEDIAVVLDEVILLASMAAESRQGESETARPVLSTFRATQPLEAGAQLDGGDVFRVGRRVFVGHSRRTNAAAGRSIRRLLEPYGYEVTTVSVAGCLHLKTGCTSIGQETLLIYRDWIDAGALKGFSLIDVPREEPSGANALTIDNTVVLSASAPRTAEKLVHHGFRVLPVDISEFEKAEGGLTCMSLLLETVRHACTRLRDDPKATNLESLT
jgi:dimethylargininase